MNSDHPILILAVASLLTSAVALGELANHAEINASGQQVKGVIMLNQAAGDSHQQVNTRLVSAGHQASTRVNITQRQAAPTPEQQAQDAGAHIRGPAFSRGTGVLGVNQGAGYANQQINAVRIELGSLPDSLDDVSLAQSVAPSSLDSGTVASQTGQRVISIDDQAFADSRGVVQLNQSAGVGNRMVNNLGIRVME